MARQRVLQFLITHPGASAGEIAERTGLSAPTVRHHLGILQSDHRVQRMEAAGGRRGGARGRPVHRYRVNEALRGNGLALLSGSLLKAWRELHQSPAGESQLVAALASEIQKQISEPAMVAAGASEISTFVARLNAFHYGARWEAGAAGPRLLFGQCPYAAIVKDHPVLCKMDAEAIERSLNVEARQSAKIDPDASKPTSCIFDLR